MGTWAIILLWHVDHSQQISQILTVLILKATGTADAHSTSTRLYHLSPGFFQQNKCIHKRLIVEHTKSSSTENASARI